MPMEAVLDNTISENSGIMVPNGGRVKYFTTKSLNLSNAQDAAVCD